MKTQNDRPLCPSANQYQTSYEQSMQTLRSLQQTGVQILSVLAIADVTVLGITFKIQKASTLLLGALILFMALMLQRSIRQWMMPYLYSAILAERFMFSELNRPTMYFSSIFLRDPDLHRRIDEITTCSNFQELQERLLKIATRSWLPDHIGIYAFMWIGILGQLILIPILLAIGWDFM